MQVLDIHPDHGAPGSVAVLTLADMPAHANDDNTSVYLGGQRVTVDFVEHQTGTVQVVIGQDARGGTFTVVVKGSARTPDAPPSGAVTAEGAQLFTVITRGNETVIVIRTMTPSTVAAGDTVTLNGEHLDAARQVRVGATIVRPTLRTAQQIKFKVPDDMVAGTHRVSLSDDTGGWHYGTRSLTVE